jgi:hypothetical protein
MTFTWTRSEVEVREEEVGVQLKGALHLLKEKRRFSGSESSQAVSARPSDEGRLKVKVNHCGFWEIDCFEYTQ